MNLTVQDVHDFVAAINSARLKAGMEALTKIEFDACDPGSSTNCLSARNYFALLGAKVYADTAWPNYGGAVSARRLASFLGTKVTSGNQVIIPSAITRVTDLFDQAVDCSYPEEILEPLRELFVEAGYVDAE